MPSPFIHINNNVRVATLAQRLRQVSLGRTGAKGGGRKAAAPASAAGGGAGGGGGASQPLKPSPVGNTLTVIRAIQGEGTEGKNHFIRRTFLEQIIAERGAALALRDLVGLRVALRALIKKEGEAQELKILAGRALEVIRGQELDKNAVDEAFCLEALKGHQSAWEQNTTPMALDHLRRGRMETQIGLARLVCHEALDAKNAAGLGESDKVSIPAEVNEALSGAKANLAGIAPGNGGDKIKKAKGGEVAATYFIDNLQTYHVQSGAPGVALPHPFTFSHLMNVLENGAYAPEVREAVRTVLASHFISNGYIEAEIRGLVEIGLASPNRELVVAALKTANLLFFALETKEERVSLRDTVIKLYLETFEGTLTADILVERNAAQATLLRMTTDVVANPHERILKPELLNLLRAYVTREEGANAARRTALAEIESSRVLAVVEPGPSGVKVEMPPESLETAWDAISKQIDQAGVDEAMIMFKESPLPHASRKRSEGIAKEWGKDPFLKRVLGSARKMSAGLVEGQTDLVRGPERLEKAGPNAAEIVELSPPTGNLEAFLKSAMFFLNVTRSFFKELRILILTDAGDGTRNNIGSMYGDQRKGAIPYFKRSLTFVSTMLSGLLLNQFPGQGSGYALLGSSDNALLFWGTLKTTEGIPIEEAMTKYNCHMAFFASRAEYEGPKDDLLTYLEAFGQQIIGPEGQVDGFAEKPTLAVLRQIKRDYVLKKFNIKLHEKLKGTENAAALFSAICTEGTTINGQKVGKNLASYATGRNAWRILTELAKASVSKDARKAWIAAHCTAVGAKESLCKEELANDLMSIADQLIYTYINSFNFVFSQEILALMGHYLYQASPTVGKELATILGNVDFSKRFSENMHRKNPAEWEAKYAEEKAAHDKGKTPEEIAQAPFGSKDDWMEQWYLARACFLLSGLQEKLPGQEKLVTEHVFENFRDEFGTAKALYEYVAEQAGVDAKGKHDHGGIVLSGIVDYFADIGTHLELELRKHEVFGSNKTMRNIFRWLGGLLRSHNVEAGAQFGNWTLLDHAFEVLDENGADGRPAMAKGLNTTVALKVRIKEEDGKTRDAVKTVTVDAKGRTEINGVVIEDIRTIYIDNKSSFAAGTELGSHSSFICTTIRPPKEHPVHVPADATIRPPKEHPVHVPAYTTIQGAEITGRVKFYGETGRGDDWLKGITIYDFIHRDTEKIYGFIADTVVARIHLLSLAGMPIEGYPVVPLAQNVVEKGGGIDPVLGHYSLNGSGLSKTQAYWGLGISLNEFKDAYAPTRVNAMQRVHQPRILKEAS